MDKTYQPSAIEKRWYAQWERDGYFSPSGDGEPYCIMIPPPNVTGTLHMGHAFQDTIMDVLTRYHRMLGHRVLWQPGTDHAGIATQMVVERQLANDGLSRVELGREAFLAKVWDWKKLSGGTIQQQLRRMGSSVDWSRERFTMDDGLSEAVTEAFVRLHEEGLIYRGKRLVNWDPVLHTALSDLEVLSKEEDGFLWNFRYPLTRSNGTTHVTVATTRPETMLGDTAVAVHPDDERYKDIVGQTVRLPLCDREIPIIADEYVDPEFGTGCVKITPAHDFNDYEIGVRHELEQINIFTIDAAINDNAPSVYRGLDRFDAREKVVADMTSAGLVESINAHKLMVPRGDRSGEVVEPYLTDQWFVKAESLAKPAIAAVDNGEIRFIPENWSKTYYEWMHNIQDWCISRQLWWGHRIPAWYDEADNIFVGRSEGEVRKSHGLADDIPLRQDEDVLDTWFSSGLWPFSTLGWPEPTTALKTFYPTNVLVTGFDIIFFWVARMIMMGIHFTGEVPFREVYIHGLIRDPEGQKMSKSKGNVMDPLDLIDGTDLESLVAKRTTDLMQPHLKPKIEKATKKYYPDGIPEFGTDALRFTFATLASTGRDIRLDLQRIEGYRNFCNKLWNAARYVLMSVDAASESIERGEAKLHLPDRWIRSRLGKTIVLVKTQLENYRLDLAAKALYEFTWHEYCDWYLELSKPILQSDEISIDKNATLATLTDVLENLLRCLHPFIPFITEEIWQRVAPAAGIDVTDTSIMVQRFPDPNAFPEDDEAEQELDWIRKFILGVRQIRGEMDISPNRSLPVILQDPSEQDKSFLGTHRRYLMELARLGDITILEQDAEPPPCATALLGRMKILVPMAGLIDVDAERKRLDKNRSRAITGLSKSENKLSNEKFRSNAPDDVIAKEHAKMEALRQEIAEFDAQLERLDQLSEKSE